MAEKDKKFYWLKLKTEFMNGEVVDFLMSQKNGANYVVLYQMLALKTINTQGRLCSEIGEVIIPFNAEKIQRECKWFDIDTVRVAIELYSKLGLVYKNEGGILEITEFQDLVGSETYWAKQKRIQRDSGQSLDNVQHTLISNISNINNINNKKDVSKLIQMQPQELQPALQEFLKMRKAIKKPMTERAFEMLLNKLNKMSQDTQVQIKILEQSILHCWQDVYELKSDQKETAHRIYTKEQLESLYTNLDNIEF